MRFRLAALLEHREDEERRARGAFARAVAQLRAADDDVRRLELEAQRTLRSIYSARSRDMRVLAAHADLLREMRERRVRERAELETEMRARERAWIDAKREYKRIDVLRQRALVAYERELDRREAAELDDANAQIRNTSLPFFGHDTRITLS